jgi:hypothetical protein
VKATTVLAPNPDGVPVYLANLPRWVLWREEKRINQKTGETETTKPPFGLKTGKKCDITKPSNWADFSHVVATVARDRAWDGSGDRAWDGYGIVLGLVEEADEILIGLDGDTCLDDDDAMAPWAVPFFAAMASYADRSPGGAGVKCLARIRLADLPAARKLLEIPEGDSEQARTRAFGPRPSGGGHAPGAQLFIAKRYFTITGQHWVTSPEDVTLLTLDQLAQLGQAFGPKEKPTSAPRNNNANQDEAEPDEATLRDKLGMAFVRNPRLRERWEGGTEGLNDATRSGRDMSILALLVGEGFAKCEIRAALRLFEHGKLLQEEQAGRGGRYVEQMWAHTKATPRAEPKAPPGWAAQHPATSSIADLLALQRQPRPRHREASYTPAALDTVWDPWDDAPPPAWPNGILSREAEDTLALVSLRDGLDHGLLCTTILAGAAAAANKASRFEPYQHDSWAVPPIIWTMTIGDSGTRKTHLHTIGFSAIREARADLWHRYKAEHRDWETRPKPEQGPEPQEPPALLVTDITPEALQNLLAASGRGTALIMDELAGMLEFNRYRKSSGSAARGFYLSAYEDTPYPVHRVSAARTVYIEHPGFAVFGGIQPHRLATFRADMETDGLLQRFVYLRAATAKASRPEIDVGRGMVELHRAIKQLCSLDAYTYRTTRDGSELIHETERAARDYATITDYGDGWPGFCYKLHGTHARFALILHMLEAPNEELIPTEQVHRAHRLVHRFILQHAADFYASLHDTRSIHHDIAGWLLTRGPADPAPQQLERILASDLTNGVKSCRPLGSKAIGEVLDPFVTGGWLLPENDYPNNRAWLFSPAIRCHFADREKAERERRANVRAMIGRIEQDREAQLS